MSKGRPTLKDWRSSGDKARNPPSAAFVACHIAGIEDLAKHGLLMRDIGVAGLAFVAPESPVIAYDDLGLRGHPGLGRAHGLARRAVEFGLEADMFVKEPRRQREHDLPCRDLDQPVFAPKRKPDVIASIRSSQSRRAQDALGPAADPWPGHRRDLPCRRQDAGRRYARFRHLEAFGLLVGIAQMKQRAFDRAGENPRAPTRK